MYELLYDEGKYIKIKIQNKPKFFLQPTTDVQLL